MRFRIGFKVWGLGLGFRVWGSGKGQRFEEDEVWAKLKVDLSGVDKPTVALH